MNGGESRSRICIHTHPKISHALWNKNWVWNNDEIRVHEKQGFFLLYGPVVHGTSLWLTWLIVLLYYIKLSGKRPKTISIPPNIVQFEEELRAFVAQKNWNTNDWFARICRISCCVYYFLSYNSWENSLF